MSNPLYVNILWHMHQPFYKDLAADRYIMPWVGLHATKDYLDMPLLVGDYPNVHATFNMVPSLLEQLDEYAQGTAIDNYNVLANKRTEDLSEDERIDLLSKFFSAHYDRMIAPHPRYAELARMKGWPQSRQELVQAAGQFTTADLRDLQCWFYLVWIDPMLRERDERLKAFMAKQRHFSEEDKQEILAITRELTGRVVPEMKRLWDDGSIEIATTPYYHPILPLLVDTNIARRARPKIALPSQRFQRPEDARRQIEMGLEYFEKIFGRRPAGMWPSEGSVCPELIPMFAEAGVRWIATDEGVLGCSLGEHFWREKDGRAHNMDALYRPYIAEHESNEVTMFFRDHYLSDLPGFKYASWAPEAAAADLIRRLEEIRFFMKDQPDPHVVSVILDGENCWEHYEDDGLPFLRAFYGALNDHKSLISVTPSQYLEVVQDHRRLKHLHSGSWINEDYSIWIGHHEDNAAWDLLAQARNDIEARLESPEGKKLDEASRERAWKSIWIAEGSDWNWWYGDDHSSGIDDQFDMLYRRHLVNAYEAVGLEPPARLNLPIAAAADTGLEVQPVSFISPTIEGRLGDFYKWFSAGHFDARRAGDSMHQAVRNIHDLYFGFDLENLYVRADLNPQMLEGGGNVELNIYIHGEQHFRVSCPLDRTKDELHAWVSREDPEKGWIDCDEITTVAVDQIFEIAMPLELLGLSLTQLARLQLALEIDDREVERCPSRAPLVVKIPDEHFEERMWNV